MEQEPFSLRKYRHKSAGYLDTKASFPDVPLDKFTKHALYKGLGLADAIGEVAQIKVDINERRGHSDFLVNLALKLLEFEPVKRPGMFGSVLEIHKSFTAEWEIMMNPYQLVKRMIWDLLQYFYPFRVDPQDLEKENYTNGLDTFTDVGPYLMTMSIYLKETLLPQVARDLVDRMTNLPDLIDATEDLAGLFSDWSDTDSEELTKRMDMPSSGPPRDHSTDRSKILKREIEAAKELQRISRMERHSTSRVNHIPKALFSAAIVESAVHALLAKILSTKDVEQRSRIEFIDYLDTELLKGKQEAEQYFATTKTQRKTEQALYEEYLDDAECFHKSLEDQSINHSHIIALYEAFNS
eukprot:Filipodium_phascolosomae@DN943_c0_g1_i1.p1